MHKGGIKLEHFIILMDDWAESTFGFHCVYSTAAVIDVWIFIRADEQRRLTVSLGNKSVCIEQLTSMRSRTRSD